MPIHTWFALIWLAAACRDGVSISFASKFLGVSRQAAITMQRSIRSAMEYCQSGHKIGGPGRDVYVRLFRLRVKAPPGRPRLNHHTVIIGSDRTAMAIDVLPQRSCQYVALWVKKRLNPGSRVYHPMTTAFRMMPLLDIVSMPQATSSVRHSPCVSTISLVKKYLRRFHNIVPYYSTQTYLKAFEFNKNRHESHFPDLLEQLSFPTQVPR